MSIPRGEAWVFDGRHVDRWTLDLPSGSGRLLAPVAFSSRDGILALFAVQPPRVVIYHDDSLQSEVPLETFPVTLGIRRGELIVGMVPPLRDPDGVDAAFVFLRTFNLTMKRWSDLLTVEPPDWWQQENRALVGEAQERAQEGGRKAFAVGTTQQRLWSSGLVGVREDRRLWFVNQYDGKVTLLSRSGAALWSGRVPGVSRAGYSREEQDALEDRLSSSGFKVGGSLPRLRPQVLALAVHGDDLAVLHRTGDSPGLRLSVLDDQTGEWNLWSLPGGVAPKTMAVLEDTLWFAHPCATVPWSAVLPRREPGQQHPH